MKVWKRLELSVSKLTDLKGINSPLAMDVEERKQASKRAKAKIIFIKIREREGEREHTCVPPASIYPAMEVLTHLN